MLQTSKEKLGQLGLSIDIGYQGGFVRSFIRELLLNKRKYITKENLYLFIGSTKTFINIASQIFVFSRYFFTEGFLKWQSRKQNISHIGSCSSYLIPLFLIMSFILQIIFDGLIIPRFAEGPTVYVLKVFFTT